MATARFIYDTATKNFDLYYATKFVTHDPVAFFEIRGKKYLVVDDLEYERAKKHAAVNKVFLASKFQKGLEIRKGNVIEIIDIIFKKLGIKNIEVPANFPLSLAERFKKKKYRLTIGPSPFYPERTEKNPLEKRWMIDVQKKVFKLFSLTEGILKKSKVKGNKLFYKGKPLTSEFIKQQLQFESIRLGLDPRDAFIVACGDQATDPHETGHGPIRPHEAIIVDIFPRDEKTLFCGDATRTFCKGKASPQLKKLYDTVQTGQEKGIKAIKAGVNAKLIHEMIVNYFQKSGYKTGEIDGTLQGFIHSTGHGIGLEVHESTPSIRAQDCKLKCRQVTSVEPGLYYRNLGGVRIEDLVFVTKNGCEILGYYPKKLEMP